MSIYTRISQFSDSFLEAFLSRGRDLERTTSDEMELSCIRGIVSVGMHEKRTRAQAKRNSAQRARRRKVARACKLNKRRRTAG